MIESLERLTLPQAATRLGLHPTDLIRILAAGEGFPPNLRFDPSQLEMIRRRGGLQVWWREGEGHDSDPVDLSRRLLRQFMEHQLIEPEMTRADNLFRGLGVRPHTGEIIIGDGAAAVMCRYVRRRQLAQQRSTEALLAAKGTP